MKNLKLDPDRTRQTFIDERVTTVCYTNLLSYGSSAQKTVHRCCPTTVRIVLSCERIMAHTLIVANGLGVKWFTEKTQRKISISLLLESTETCWLQNLQSSSFCVSIFAIEEHEAYDRWPRS